MALSEGCTTIIVRVKGTSTIKKLSIYCEEDCNIIR